MPSISIPGFGQLSLTHLVCDFNGTLAVDGKLIPGLAERLVTLSRTYQIHVITADTSGGAAEQLAGLPFTVTVIGNDDQAEAKQVFVNALNPDEVVAIGNGRNDQAMLRAAALGIVVIQQEGAAAAIFHSADLIATNIGDALDLLRHPKRLIATLRS